LQPNARSIDLGVYPGIASVLPYTNVTEGFRVAGERLLLLSKIRCFAERGEGQKL
jgi:hypothetical protein